MKLSIADAKKSIGVEGFSIKGTIKDVYERRTGTGKYGDYSFQDIMLTEGNESIKVTIGNREEITPREIGQLIEISPYLDKKTGMMKGVKVKDEGEYGIKIKANGGASITYGNQEPVVEEESQEVPPPLDTAGSFNPEELDALSGFVKGGTQELEKDREVPVEMVDKAQVLRLIEEFIVHIEDLKENIRRLG